ncbi:MAG: hypothetical protein EBZ77_08870, partial [Chitinophagia bacterium]|nr:hypothetical protein [Chitinophagia bacterium]
MYRLLVLVVMAMALLKPELHAQTTAAGYNFAQVNGTYTSISGTTAIASAWDDQRVAAIPIGFTFAFRGVNFTAVSVCANGWLAFGRSTSTTNTYTPISTLVAGSDSGVVAAFARDLQSSTSSPTAITYTTSGSSPNRVFTVQWASFRPYGQTGTMLMNMQIKLYETSNIIKVIYGSWGGTLVTTTSYTGQIGIRGTATSDFNNRTATSTFTGTTAGTANTSTVTMTTSSLPTNGLTFVWCPNAAQPSITSSGSGGCSPNSFSISGSTNYTYSWSPSAGLSASTGTSVTANPTANTTYTATVSDTTGCSVYPTFVSSVTPAAISGATFVCTGRTTTLSTTTTGGSWSSSNTSLATVSTGGVVTGLSSGSVNISYTMPSGCYAIKAFTVSPTPTVAVSPSSAVYCSASGGVVLTPSGTSTSYSWAPASTVAASTSGAAVIVTPTATVTTYTVTGTLGSCTATATSVITRYISPSGIVPFVAGDTVICYPGYALMTEAGTGGTWSSSDLSVFGVDGSGNITPVGTGTAKVYYTSVCGVDSLSLRVSSGGFTVSVTPSSTNYCTSGGPVTLTASSSGGADIWLWTNYDGSAPIGLSATGTATVTASPSVTATYALFGTNSSTGCHAVTTATVTNVTPAAITGTANVCVGATRTYACTTSGGRWSSSLTTVATVDTVTGVITGVTAGNATITYMVTATGCYVTRAITVNALPTLSVTPSGAAIVCGGVALPLGVSGASTYTWAPTTSLSATTGATVTTTASSAITYTVTGTDANGCVNTATKSVTTGPTYVGAYVSAVADTVCPGASATLTAQVAANDSTYAVSSITYTSFPTTGFTSGPTGDDVNATATIPFTFNFFG